MNEKGGGKRTKGMRNGGHGEETMKKEREEVVGETMRVRTWREKAKRTLTTEMRTQVQEKIGLQREGPEANL